MSYKNVTIEDKDGKIYHPETNINNVLGIDKKADKDYVDEKLNNKANIEYVDKKIEDAEAINTTLQNTITSSKISKEKLEGENNRSESNIVTVSGLNKKTLTLIEDLKNTSEYANLNKQQLGMIIDMAKEVNIELLESITNADLDGITAAIKELRQDLEDIPEIFHDLPDNEITEEKLPGDFKTGITVCANTQKKNFPTIDNFGVSITVANSHRGYGQIYIDVNGILWSRRSSVVSSWGDWSSIANLEHRFGAKATYYKEDLNNLLDTGIYTIMNPSNAPTSEAAIVEVIHSTIRSNNENHKVQKCYTLKNPSIIYTRTHRRGVWSKWKEFDFNRVNNTMRSSTLVVASEDSNARSRFGADRIIGLNEDAGLILSQMISDSDHRGGKITLKEGTYNIRETPITKDTGESVIIEGQGDATKIITHQNSAFNINMANKNSTTIKNLTIIGNEDHDGINIGGSGPVLLRDIIIKNTKYGINIVGDVKATIDNISIVSPKGNGIFITDNVKLKLINSYFTDCRWASIFISKNSFVYVNGCEFYKNRGEAILVTGNSSLRVANSIFKYNIDSGIYVSNTLKDGNIHLTNLLFKGNSENADFTNFTELNLGGRSSSSTKNCYVSGCQFIGTGNTRAVYLSGEKHMFVNNQFIGSFMSKLQDLSNNSVIRDNMGV